MTSIMLKRLRLGENSTIHLHYKELQRDGLTANLESQFLPLREEASKIAELRTKRTMKLIALWDEDYIPETRVGDFSRYVNREIVIHKVKFFTTFCPLYFLFICFFFAHINVIN